MLLCSDTLRDSSETKDAKKIPKFDLHYAIQNHYIDKWRTAFLSFTRCVIMTLVPKNARI